MASGTVLSGLEEQELSSIVAEVLTWLVIDELNSLESVPAQQLSSHWIAHNAHPFVKRTLSTFPQGAALGRAAIRVIKIQIALRATQVAADRALVLNEDVAEAGSLDLLSSNAKGKQSQSSLFVQAAKSIASRFGRSPQIDRELLKELRVEHASVIRRAIMLWNRLPFPVMVELEPPMDLEFDEW